MEFKDRLRGLRKGHGLLQADLAKALKLSTSLISAYETGDRKPSFEVLEDIADFFNVDIDYLIGRETGSTYYLDPEAAEIARALSERPELKTLMKTAMKADPNDIKVLQNMANALTRKG